MVRGCLGVAGQGSWSPADPQVYPDALLDAKCTFVARALGIDFRTIGAELPAFLLVAFSRKFRQRHVIRFVTCLSKGHNPELIFPLDFRVARDPISEPMGSHF